MRINKRQRRRYRKSATHFLELADKIEFEKPYIASSLRNIAAAEAKRGSPPKSKRGRGKK